MGRQTISVYTTCNDAFDREYTLLEGLAMSLTFCDEFVFVDGGSTDGTLEVMEKIASIDPRVKIFSHRWSSDFRVAMYMLQKNVALSKCTSDICCLLDADEVYTDELCRFFRSGNFLWGGDTVASLGTKHFWGNYRTLCVRDPLAGYSYYTGKIYAFRNHLGIHHGNVEGDPDGLLTNRFDAVEKSGGVAKYPLDVFHFGHVRSACEYVGKKNRIERAFSDSWVPISDWKFRMMIEGNPDCFCSADDLLAATGMPISMQARVSRTTDQDGFVVEEKMYEYNRWIARRMIEHVVPAILTRRKSGGENLLLPDDYE